MRTSSLRRVLVYGPLCAGLLAASGPQALANGHRGRAAGVAATSYAVPTEYVVATEYVVPTTYVVPTAYVPTYSATSYVLQTSYAYVTPTVYATAAAAPVYETTSYVLGTPVVYPTSVVLPRVYEVIPTVAWASDPCGTVAEPSPRSYTAAPAPKAPAKSGQGQAQGATESSAVKPPPKSLDSEPSAPAGGASRAADKGAGTDSARRETGPVDSSVSPPPASPAPERDLGPAAPVTPPTGPATPPAAPAAGATPITPAPVAEPPAPAPLGPAGATNPPAPTAPPDSKKATPPTAPGGTPPTAPGGDAGAPVELPEPAPGFGEGTVIRKAQRPVLSTANRAGQAQRYLRSVAHGDLNVLEGKVISAATGRPEEGVQLTLASLTGAGERPVQTDALGRFAVKLPDGEWAVRVTMPSGRVYAVSRLSVVEGQITDDLGRDIPTLRISR